MCFTQRSMSELARLRGDAVTVPKHPAVGDSQGKNFKERAENGRGDGSLVEVGPGGSYLAEIEHDPQVDPFGWWKTFQCFGDGREECVFYGRDQRFLFMIVTAEDLRSQEEGMLSKYFFFGTRDAPFIWQDCLRNEKGWVSCVPSLFCYDFSC